MNSFNILVCEDSPADQRNISLHLNSVKKSLPDIAIEFKILEFEETYRELYNDYDLLILDLGDALSHLKNAGENILMHNKGNRNIPTVVYTSNGDAFEFEFKSKKIEYPFLLDKLTKIYTSGTNLIDFIKGFIIVSSEAKYYTLYNPFDENLSLSIKLIGLGSFNYILYRIREKFKGHEIWVYPMSSGLSGAILFRLEMDNTRYVLKLSKEVAKLKEEHENGMQLYNQFPPHLINHISYESYYSFDQNVLGILIRNVEESETFFDFLKNRDLAAVDEIDAFLQELYLNHNALSAFFKTKLERKVSWTAIFDKIDEAKIALMEKSFAGLKPIIDRYGEFDPAEFRRIAVSNDYGQLTVRATLTDEYQSPLILAHGDFHSKNILVQGANRPVIIDTGSIGYQHWSLDYARLIVHLFITGLDTESCAYYDLAELPNNILWIDKMLQEEAIELDGKNDRFITAINWLIAHYHQIFANTRRFELQLGLMKEFLQASYRFDTIPPNKRALALIAAHKCLSAADQAFAECRKK